jgi:hypothetical protein
MRTSRSDGYQDLSGYKLTERWEHAVTSAVLRIVGRPGAGALHIRKIHIRNNANAAPPEDFVRRGYSVKQLLLSLSVIRERHTRCRDSRATSYAFEFVQAQIELELLNVEKQALVVVDCFT